MTESERKAELEHFSEIEAVIDENLEKLYQMRNKLKEQLLDVRREMWDGGRHLIRDFDDVIELAARDAGRRLACPGCRHVLQLRSGARVVRASQRPQECKYHAETSVQNRRWPFQDDVRLRLSHVR